MGQGRDDEGVVAVWAAVFIAVFPLYWAVVTPQRARNVELGDLWLPVSRFESALAARERLLALAAATTRALAPRWMRGLTALVVQRYMVRALFQWTVKG